MVDDRSIHIPVMLSEMLHFLSPQDGHTYIDATFGAGGYTKAILESSECNVIAIDRDDHVSHFAEQISQQYKDRFQFICNRASVAIPTINTVVHGIVFDCGLSSMQLFGENRGFSFMKDSPLSMTMGNNSIDAQYLVNKYQEYQLAQIILEYGEEGSGPKIARAIKQYRQNKTITTTRELYDIITTLIPKHHTQRIARVFQAIRIEVNNELDELRDALDMCIKPTCYNARLIGVTFHSLEDRIFKYFMREKCTAITKKPVIPTKEEARINSRCRSAKLRASDISPVNNEHDNASTI